MTEHETVTPTPTVNELEEGDLVTYACPSDNGWELVTDWHRLSDDYWPSVVILEVKRKAKPKCEPGDLVLTKGGRVAMFRPCDHPDNDEWPWVAGDDAFTDEDSVFGVYPSIPAVAVPKADWDALVERIDSVYDHDIAGAAIGLVDAWKEATGNE